MISAATIENPIKTSRLEERKSLQGLADEIGIHMQAVYLAECGVYPRVLPSILYYFGWDEAGEHAVAYRQFQKAKRQVNGHLWGLDRLTLTDLGVPLYMEAHPLIAFRQILSNGVTKGISRMMFAKRFCIQPVELFFLETRKRPEVSEQFRTAMREAGLDDIVLSELEARIQEYAQT